MPLFVLSRRRENLPGDSDLSSKCGRRSPGTLHLIRLIFELYTRTLANSFSSERFRDIGVETECQAEISRLVPTQSAFHRIVTDSDSQPDEDKFIAEIERQLAAGEYVDFISLIEHFPECADRLRDLMSRQQRGEDDSELDESIVMTSSKQPEKDAATTLQAPGLTESRIDDPIPLGEFGDYKLLDLVAKGGMGFVFRAYHYKLDRVVALKAIRNGRFTTTEEVERLKQEARAAGILTHPNIVSVYEIGEHSGHHFFTMEYVEGHSLEEMVRESPLPARKAADYVRIIARAVQYAHEKSIVHRDIKPSNVLVTLNDEPRITDFGVAETVYHESDSGDAKTRESGEIVGTPQFMSPEQADGEKDAFNPATDIYSMGALLYCLLTGRPPFQAESESETLAQVRSQEPAAPRLLNAKVPRDLETICLKCLNKDPGRRYGSAADLSEDLGRFLRGEPIMARPVGRIGQLLKACRRNPVVTLLATCAVLLAAALIAVQGVANSHLNRLNSEILEANRKLADSRTSLRIALNETRQSQTALQELLYVSDMREAGKAWANRDMRLLVSLLERQQPRPGEKDLRGGEWHFLWNHARIPSHLIAQNEHPLYDLCFSSDGRTVATCGRDAVIRLYDAGSYSQHLEIATGQVEVNGLAFTSDGHRLASAGDDGTVRIWKLDIPKGRATEQLRIEAFESQAFNIVFTPDDKSIVSAGHDPVLRVWNAETGESLGVLEGHQRTTGAIAISHDGRHLVSASSDGHVAVWDMDTLTQVKMVDPDIGRLTAVDLSPDGKHLVIASAKHVVETRTVPDLDRTNQFEHLNAVQSVQFVPNGDAVIASDRGGMIRFWPLGVTEEKSGRCLGIPNTLAWKAHRDRVYAMAIDPAGDRLFSVGSDGKLISWQVNRESPVWELEKADRPATSMQFAGASGLLATVDKRNVELWNPEDGSLTRTLKHPDSEVKSIDTCRAGRTIAVGTESGLIFVWDMEVDDEPVKTIYLGDRFRVDYVCVSPEGSFLAAAGGGEDSADDVLRVFDLKSGDRITTIRTDHCDTAAFSPDERWLFTEAPHNHVQVWRLPDGELAFEDHGHVNSINHIEFSPDGRWVATASDDRLIKLWDVKTWSVVHTLDGHRDDVESVSFSPDSQTLASTGDDGRIKFWNVSAGQMVFELDVWPEQVEQIAFSPEGHFLACRIHHPSESDRQYRIEFLDWHCPQDVQNDRRVSTQ